MNKMKQRQIFFGTIVQALQTQHNEGIARSVDGPK